MFGLPPEWPDPDEETTLSKTYHLRPNPNRTEPVLYFVGWLLVFGLSFIVPLMSLAYKILMPRELASYYSSAFQRAFGNPEARAYEDARTMAEEPMGGRWREPQPQADR